MTFQFSSISCTTESIALCEQSSTPRNFFDCRWPWFSLSGWPSDLIAANLICLEIGRHGYETAASSRVRSLARSLARIFTRRSIGEPACLSRSKYLFDSTHLPWLWLVASHVNLAAAREGETSRYRRENPFFHQLHSPSGCPRSEPCIQEIAITCFFFYYCLSFFRIIERGTPAVCIYIFSITSQVT